MFARTLTCVQFILLLLLLSLQNLSKTDLENVEEENCLLPCVQKCFTTS